MKRPLSTAIVAGLVMLTANGCAPSLTRVHYHHAHHHRAGIGDVIVAGAILGTAVAVAASKPSPPEPAYHSTYYFYGPPPPPQRRSPRDSSDDGSRLPAFDPVAARAALNDVDVSDCHRLGAPHGFGHAKVLINPDGRISKVIVDEPAGMSKGAAACIGNRLGAATVPPFRGSLVTMGTTFSVR